MPEISRFYGLVILMYYNDHEPPHFHVRYQDYEITINIDTGEVKGKMSRTALKLVYKWMDLHKKRIIRQLGTLQTKKTFNMDKSFRLAKGGSKISFS